MATNWTDATLFVTGDVVLPKLLTNVTTSNYHDWVKLRVGYYVKYYYHDYKDFDIEEITSASLTALEEPALTLNLHKICMEQSATALDDDTFEVLSEKYKAQYMEEMKMISPTLEFDEPDGINDRKAFSIGIGI
jgi:hypothetical protein